MRDAKSGKAAIIPSARKPVLGDHSLSFSTRQHCQPSRRAERSGEEAIRAWIPGGSTTIFQPSSRICYAQLQRSLSTALPENSGPLRKSHKESLLSARPTDLNKYERQSSESSQLLAHPRAIAATGPRRSDPTITDRSVVLTPEIPTSRRSRETSPENKNSVSVENFLHELRSVLHPLVDHTVEAAAKMSPIAIPQRA